MTQPGGVTKELDVRVGMMVTIGGHRPHARWRVRECSLAGAGGELVK
jgi:hypothetical protein